MPLPDAWEMERLRALVDRSLSVEEAWVDGGRPHFVVRPVPDLASAFASLRAATAPLGYLPVLRRQGERLVVALASSPPRGPQNWALAAALFLATVATTVYAGYAMSADLVRRGMVSSELAGGITFSASLLLILVTHEMGHKIVSIRRDIDASLPYFIPFPSLIGTLGAVIVTRTPAPSRDALVDLGASGPIVGFLVAIPVLVYGVAHSAVAASVPAGSFLFPDPPLARWLAGWLLRAPRDAIIIPHPTYMAGWIGLLVTSLNLLPAGMLDGGHVSRAIAGPRWHRYISVAAVALAVWLRYYLMAVLMALLALRGHPGPLDDVTPPAWSRLLLAAALIAIFLVSAVPLSVTIAP